MRKNDVAGKAAGAIYVFLAASTVLILDRLTKYIIIKKLSQGQSIKIFPNIFHITLVLNKGIAFGLFKEWRIFFIVTSTLAISFILFYIRRNKQESAPSLLALGIILGGAIGNFIDRISIGCVIDFLDFRIWPVFNIADSSITIGAIMLAWSVLRQKAKVKS